MKSFLNFKTENCSDHVVLYHLRGYHYTNVWNDFKECVHD